MTFIKLKPAFTMYWSKCDKLIQKTSKPKKELNFIKKKWSKIPPIRADISVYGNKKWVPIITFNMVNMHNSKYCQARV